MREIVFAGGCFWGVEHLFKQIRGVLSTETGFANGNTENPTYEEVYTDTTGFAEVVKISYDENVISLQKLLEFFFMAIDPTSLNRQGNDCGTRYRTGIYFSSDSDKSTIEDFLDNKQKDFDTRIVVECEKLKNYFPASEYHQDYLDKHPDGYCHLGWELFEKVRRMSEESTN